MQSPATTGGAGRRIAVIEDEPLQLKLYQMMLESAGYEVHGFGSTLEFRRRRGVGDVDLILLDWELPGESGTEFLQSLRDSPNRDVPVIFLTAHEGEQHVVEALRMGADDYVVKPPKAGELVARVATVLRRALGRGADGDTLRCDPYVFDLGSRTLCIGDQPVKLTAREFDLALYFFQRADRAVSRDALMVQVWNTAPTVSTRSIDTFVSRLRKSLGLNGEHGWKLEGLYQQGYRLSRAARSA
jgi:DNA-binding response OmpR family regulator